MNWLNLEIKTLRSAGYIGSAPIERATWINALAYCCEQENGGRIEGARKWKDRQWQQLCGVTSREIDRASKLMTWDGDDLIVSGYPHAKEAEVRSKREAGREGGHRSGEARAKQNGSTASSTACPSASTEGERKEKEKGNRKEGEGAAAPACEDWIATLKGDATYAHVQIDRELGKMRQWLALPANKGRQLTRRFALNWLNKIEPPLRESNGETDTHTRKDTPDPDGWAAWLDEKGLQYSPFATSPPNRKEVFARR